MWLRRSMNSFGGKGIPKIPDKVQVTPFPIGITFRWIQNIIISEFPTLSFDRMRYTSIVMERSKMLKK